mgnify:CR=1 FL=1
MAKYLNTKAIKGIGKKHGRRVGADFISAVNEFVHERVTKACETRNGGKITLDSDVAIYVGFKPLKHEKHSI